MQSLRADEIPADDLGPLANLDALQLLTMRNAPVSDLSPISELTGLETLLLSDSSLSDLSPLRDLTRLTQLWIRDTHVLDITPLKNMVYLRSLYLDDNEILDISPLENLINLEFLYLDRNYISDLHAVQKLSNLRNLGLTSNLIDTTPGSAASEIIASLTQNGTEVRFDYQKDYLWRQRSVVVDDWRGSDWFGWFADAGFPWIWHAEHGWLYTIGEEQGSITVFDQSMGVYWWVGDNLYPYVYVFGDLNKWLLYIRGAAPGNRWFYDADTGYIRETDLP